MCVLADCAKESQDRYTEEDHGKLQTNRDAGNLCVDMNMQDVVIRRTTSINQGALAHQSACSRPVLTNMRPINVRTGLPLNNRDAVGHL